MNLNPKTLKISSSFILILAAAAFAAESLGYDVLDNYKSLSQYDSQAWVVLLMALSLGQLYLLRCGSGCLKCRVWGDFLLQLSGFVLLVVGLAFIAVYPPFRPMMAIFPLLGVLFIVLGRLFAKQTRQQLKGAA